MSKPTEEELDDIQGIIVSGYGHLSYACFLFLHVEDTAKAKGWLKNLIPELTTSKPWRVLADGRKDKPHTALNVAFTHDGLKALDLPEETLNSFAPEFTVGIIKRAEILGDDGDSAPLNWELGGLNTERVDLVLMLYGKDDASIRGLVDEHQEMIKQTDQGIREVSVQYGHRPESAKEPFGFRDGLSQPQIEGIESHRKGDPAPAVKKGEFILGYLNEYGLYPVSPVVPAANDPDHILPGFPAGALPECRDFGCHGSYMVYRKLEQHVAKFWQFIGEHANRVPSEMNLLASKLVGRWPSGAPMALAPDKDNPALEDENSFSYTPQDKMGYRCPIGAHIRRANPRDALVNDDPAQSYKTSSRHSIIRRGIPYGEPAFPPEDVENGKAPLGLLDDGKSRGLHFFVINASIARQFEFLLQTWCNQPTFAVLFKDKDPIIGNNDESFFMTIQGNPIRKRISNMPRFVTVKGGAYFFLPSKRALRYLASNNQS